MSGGGGGINWNPMQSSLGTYVANQVGSGPHIDLDPSHSTPGQAVVNTGSAIANASKGNFTQSGNDLLGALGDVGQTALGGTAALLAPPVGIGMLQNESNQNDPGPQKAAEAAAAQQQQQQDAFNQQQAQQQAQTQQRQAQEQTTNTAAYNQENGLEDSLRNAYQIRRQKAATGYDV